MCIPRVSWKCDSFFPRKYIASREWMNECTNVRVDYHPNISLIFYFFVDTIWLYIEEDTLLNFDRAYFTIQLRLSHFRIMCTWPFALTAEWDLDCIIIILLHLREVYMSISIGVPLLRNWVYWDEYRGLAFKKTNRIFQLKRKYIFYVESVKC